MLVIVITFAIMALISSIVYLFESAEDLENSPDYSETAKSITLLAWINVALVVIFFVMWIVLTYPVWRQIITEATRIMGEADIASNTAKLTEAEIRKRRDAARQAALALRREANPPPPPSVIEQPFPFTTMDALPDPTQTL